jgi:hypothetical protein
MTVKQFQYCPDCGTSKECENAENAKKSADEHNRKCNLIRVHNKMRVKR